MNPRKYLNPAKVNGGISRSPILIRIQDEDQMTTTTIASRIALSLDGAFTLFLSSR